ncbi:MAG: hypothetical protein AAB890_03070, partial [Patescibacteria group bacterium]
MVKKVVKDIFVRRKRIRPLSEELEMVKSSDKKFLSKLIIFVFAFILFIGFGWVVLGKISSAVINVTPHQEVMDVDLKLKASRLEQNENAKSNNLVFEIMQLEKEEASIIVATGVAAGGQKASGQIVVYNNYSSAPQTLIANTRFESPNGRIYRIKERIAVPGMGSKEVTVYAEEPGEKYNIGLVDFTIPGLKEGPRYSKVYARSKTEIKGGISGSVKIIKTEDIEKAKNGLLEKIKNDLIKSLFSQKPEGFLIYQSAVKIGYQYDQNNLKAGDTASSSLFKVKGTATGFLIKEDNLSKTLVESKAGKFKKLTNGGDVYAANLKDLEFNLLSVDPENKNINFQ